VEDARQGLSTPRVQGHIPRRCIAGYAHRDSEEKRRLRDVQGRCWGFHRWLGVEEAELDEDARTHGGVSMGEREGGRWRGFYR